MALRNALRGHTGRITSVAFSKNGESVVSGSEDGSVRVWNVHNGAQIRNLEGQLGTVSSVAISGDGELIAAGLADKTVRLWEIRSGAPSHIAHGHTDAVTDVAFAPNSKQLASSSVDGSVRIWCASTGHLVRALRHKSAVTSVAYSPNGMDLACGTRDYGGIHLWRVADGKHLDTWEGQLRISVESLAYSRHGRWLAADIGQGVSSLWQYSSGAHVSDLFRDKPLPQNPIDLSELESASAWIIQRNRDEQLQFGSQPVRRNRTVSFSPEGSTLATVLSSGDVGLWQASNGRFIGALPSHWHGVSAVTFAPTSHLFALTFGNRAIELRQSADGALVRKLDQPGSLSDTVALTAFSSDGGTLLSKSLLGEVALWRVADGRLLQDYTPSASDLALLAVSPDGLYAAIRDSPRSIRIWNAPDAPPIPPLQVGDNRLSAATFSADHKLLALGSVEGEINVWVLDGGHRFKTLQGHRQAISSIAFSPDGAVLASASGDNTVRLWTVADGNLTATLVGHQGPVRSITFTRDGSHVVSTAADSTRFWKLESRELAIQIFASQSRDALIVVDGSSRHFDVTGKGVMWALKDVLACRFGGLVLPSEVCTEEARVPGLLGNVLAGAPIAIEP